MTCTAVHIAAHDPQKPVNLFTYAAFTAANVHWTFIPPQNHAFAEDLTRVFKQHWRLTTFNDAAIIVYAHAFRDCPATHELARRARSARKPLIFLEMSENEPPSTVPYGTVYRPSIFGKHRRPNEKSCPAWHGDLLTERGIHTDVALSKPERPVLGFCGFVGTPFLGLMCRLTGQHQKADGLSIRQKVLSVLAQSPDLACNFVRRSRYLGMASLAPFDAQVGLKRQRAEYVANIVDCPYGLAIRGKGNHSVRFFELLCAGRIPVFINTDCVLPFEDLIDYRKHVVWIECDHISDAGQIISEFNRSVGGEAFAQMMRDNRRLWEEWLSPVGFHLRVVKP